MKKLLKKFLRNSREEWEESTMPEKVCYVGVLMAPLAFVLERALYGSHTGFVTADNLHAAIHWMMGVGAGCLGFGVTFGFNIPSSHY